MVENSIFLFYPTEAIVNKTTQGALYWKQTNKKFEK